MVVVLVHSPLVGPFTWWLVAQELKARGIDVLVPRLIDSDTSDVPYWKQYAESVAREVAVVPGDRPLTLVAHSGAGPLLPAIREAVGRPVAGYVFVDAGIPENNASHLDLLAAEGFGQLEPFRQMLAAGGRFPAWTDEILQPLVPQDAVRRRLIAELHPQPLAYFEQPIPVFDGWPDAPAYYLQLSPVYDGYAAEARKRGWPTLAIEAGHFHMLVDPTAVTDAIQQLLVSG